MLWRTMFPANFISSDDLPDGKEFTWTISAVVGDDVRKITDKGKQKKERLLIISFAELEAKAEREGKPSKRYIPCKTVARLIGRTYGPEVKDWIEKPLTLFRTTCRAWGNPVEPCLRILDPSGHKIWNPKKSMYLPKES